MTTDLERLRWRDARLRLNAINLDPRFQPREKLDQATIRKYASAMRRGDRFPPISVAKVKGALCLVDGFHRAAAAEEAGLSDVNARVAAMSDTTAVAFAIEANATHGLSLSRKDKHRCFEMYVGACRHLRPDGDVKSLRQIRRDLGNIAAPTTISKWLRSVGVEPSYEEHGPSVSWAEDLEANLETAEASEVSALLDTAEDMYQQLNDPEDRRAIRWAIRNLSARLDAGEATLDV